jgi:hypothetical protein
MIRERGVSGGESYYGKGNGGSREGIVGSSGGRVISDNGSGLNKNIVNIGKYKSEKNIRPKNT